MSIITVFILYCGITKWFATEVSLHLKCQTYQGYFYGKSTVSIKLHFLEEKGRPIMLHRKD